MNVQTQGFCHNLSQINLSCIMVKINCVMWHYTRVQNGTETYCMAWEREKAWHATCTLILWNSVIIVCIDKCHKLRMCMVPDRKLLLWTQICTPPHTHIHIITFQSNTTSHPKIQRPNRLDTISPFGNTEYKQHT